ncbi:MAG: RidA family protein [Acidobacteria bacterium]|nr:RidA family protein [Acidobacteriota bacterium]
MKNSPRRRFLSTAAGVTAVGAAAAARPAAAATTGKRKVQGGTLLGNMFFSSGLTGVRAEARKDPHAFGGDVKEQTHNIMKAHKANLEALGSSLENVVKVTVFLADVKTEKGAFNEAYAEYFKKDAPSRTALGGIFPDTQTKVEIELVAWIP